MFFEAYNMVASLIKSDIQGNLESADYKHNA